MNLLHRLKGVFRPDDKEPVLVAPKPPIVPVLEPPEHIPGRVITSTKHPEYQPDSTRHGGRIVKAMPRKLRKIKEGQESREALDE